MTRDEPSLLAAILAGATERFGEFVALYDRCVRGVVDARVRDPVLREEVVQTTFCLAFRGLAEVDAPERVTGWLAAIARNAAADALRQREARAAREVTLDGIDDVETRSPADAGWIWEEVAKLEGADREALTLRYREGLSYREIARRLQLPGSTVRGRIFEARRALRRRLERRELEP